MRPLFATFVVLIASLAAVGQGQTPGPAPDPISSPAEVLRGIAEQVKPWSTEPTPAPPTIMTAPEFVAITTADGTRVDNAALEKLVKDLPPGEFVALLVPKPGEKLQTLRISIAVQGPQPPPVVVNPPVVDPSVPVVDPPAPPVVPTDKVTTVTYVWDYPNMPDAPPAVHAALNKLNRQGILATTFEKDTFDGDDETPDQYKAAKARAEQEGMPCLVVLSGDKVLRTVKSPTTEAQVLEAAK